MKIIVGLGNPGKEYTNTRHNVGFMFINVLAKHPRLNAVDSELKFESSKKFSAEMVEFNISGEKIILVKPQTFMNLSGKSIRSILDFYKAPISDLIIVSDDLDLPLGMSRTRLSGSSGGHNGLNSIITEIGTDDFKRLRIGIADKNVGGLEVEHPYDKPEAKIFVLEKFNKREQPIIDKMIERAADIIIECIADDADFTATTFEA